MQIELIKPKHEELLRNDFGITFDDVLKMTDDELEEFLIQKLGMAECDEIEASEGKEYSARGEIISEIIDIICGPYDPEEINDSVDDESDE